MKISATQYAKTLYEITKDKSQSEIVAVLKDFVSFLAKNNQIKKAEEIIKKFEHIFNSEENILEAEITSREKLNDDSLDKVGEFIKSKYQAKKVELKNRIDEKLLGGIIIRIEDDVLNGSVNKQLDVLRNNLINN
jgi:F-type H+-transporting ATPase subunit delta